MSLSRSPSPQRGGGWSTPGLERRTAPNSYSNSQHHHHNNNNNNSNNLNGSNGNDITWAQAQAKSAKVNGYPANNGNYGMGFIGKHMRKISSGLPVFNYGDNDRFTEKEKLNRGKWQQGSNSNTIKGMLNRFGRMIWRMRLRVLPLLALVLILTIFLSSHVKYWYRRVSWLGGGSKFVVILAANQGGGVMEWKGPREWAIERDSVRNKKKYVAKWGYDLEIVDMSTKKRYAHEWRESWEKVDVVRNAMRKYPNAEWFWWLDLNTFVMEPTYSLQSHIFNNLGRNTYRDINMYNPLDIAHPPNSSFLDEESRSPVGDGKQDSINIVIPQDCGGFNLGSFFVRRSPWTDRLLDIWWDPVAYEQKHMEWEHKEQDAFEYMYANQPWVRSHVAFIPQRKVNSFPPGACGDQGDIPWIHYQERDRDFLVNMAGCEWGRDCWGEMYNYRELSNRLNRSRWEKFKDFISDTWNGKNKN